MAGTETNAASTSAKRKGMGNIAAAAILIASAAVFGWRYLDHRRGAPPTGTVDSLPACASPDARAALENAVENNAAKNIATLKLLDVQGAQELKSNPTQRLCAATLVLNSGPESARYILTRASTGGVLVQLGADLDIETAKPSTTAAPATAVSPSEATAVSATPGAAAGADELYTYDIPKAFPKAYTAWQTAASAAGFTDPWSRDLTGDITGSPMSPVTLGGKTYLLGSHCVQHECGSEEVAIMFPLDQSKAFGTVTQESTPDGPAVDTPIGSPTPAEAACFQKASSARSDQPVKSCD